MEVNDNNDEAKNELTVSTTANNKSTVRKAAGKSEATLRTSDIENVKASNRKVDRDAAKNKTKVNVPNSRAPNAKVAATNAKPEGRSTSREKNAVDVTTPGRVVRRTVNRADARDKTAPEGKESGKDSRVKRPNGSRPAVVGAAASKDALTDASPKVLMLKSRPLNTVPFNTEASPKVLMLKHVL